MLVKMTWEFDADVSDIDGKIIEKKEFAKELARREMEYLLEKKEIEVSDFDVTVDD